MTPDGFASRGDIEEQINSLHQEIEGLKETIEEVTTGLYTLVGSLISR